MLKRVHITVRGAVQGVGFRPFVYRLAGEIGLKGWVMNGSSGLIIDVEGTEADLEQFLARIGRENPPRSSIQSFEYSSLDPVGHVSFTIRESDPAGERTTLILPDIAPCPDCLSDITNRENRRYRYPFTNCTNCGPRFTIIEALPYDRKNTSMKHFAMCEECSAEYHDPSNRRFHAQPNACPLCGPHVWLWDDKGGTLSANDDALNAAADLLERGSIVAMKGVGGFHLMVDARNQTAVEKLRLRKHREEKPFAVMAASVEMVRRFCEVSILEERLLRSAEAPIVLLQKTSNPSPSEIAAAVAPGNPWLGVMLPSSPLHHIVLNQLGFPLVATSGNLTDEPICFDERDALERLHGIADVFLVHNRPILRYVDDSIVRVLMGREMVLRRSRGFAPLPIGYSQRLPDAIAVGAHLKNAVAVAHDTNVFLSQHIGDLESEQSLRAFRTTIEDLRTLYQLRPSMVVADMHPDYLSSVHARSMNLPLKTIQHHHAHIASCMAENELSGEVLGIAWDGTGWGPDGTVWGGEFLIVNQQGYTRAATFRTFPLVGGDAAVREPRRSALGALYEMFGSELFVMQNLEFLQAFADEELLVFRKMLEGSLHSPRTSSVGRLFDAVASVIGIRQRSSFEGQAAMELEFTADPRQNVSGYPVELSQEIRQGGCAALCVVDWRPILRGILDDLRMGTDKRIIATRFHAGLAEAALAVARTTGEKRVVLSGGCFQNTLLTEMTVKRLRAEGFAVYWHQRIPPNDGGIALGQIHAAVVQKQAMHD